MKIDYESVRYGWVRDVEKPKKCQKKASLYVEDLYDNSLVELTHRRKDRAYKIFREMKPLGMPITAVPAKKKNRFCYVAASTRIIESSDELADEIVGTFAGSIGRKFFLKKTNNNFDSICSKIEESKGRGQEYWMVVLNTDNAREECELINILSKKDPAECCIYTPYNYEFDEFSLRPVSQAKVSKLFHCLASLGTDPYSRSPRGIPFLLADYGCEPRCHAMCREILKYDVTPVKLWAFSNGGYFEIDSCIHPSSKVPWSHHTAPALITKKGLAVLDPSLAKRPLSVYEWFAKFGKEPSRIDCTSHHIYNMSNSLCRFSSDPQYKITEQRLMELRLNLQCTVRYCKSLPCSY